MNTPIVGTVVTIASEKTRKGEEKNILTIDTGSETIEAYVFPQQMPMMEGVSVNDEIIVHGFKAKIGLYHPIGTVKVLEIHATMETYEAARAAAAVRKAAWDVEQAAKTTTEEVAA